MLLNTKFTFLDIYFCKKYCINLHLLVNVVLYRIICNISVGILAKFGYSFSAYIYTVYVHPVSILN